MLEPRMAFRVTRVEYRKQTPAMVAKLIEVTHGGCANVLNFATLEKDLVRKHM